MSSFRSREDLCGHIKGSMILLYLIPKYEYVPGILLYLIPDMSTYQVEERSSCKRECQLSCRTTLPICSLSGSSCTQKDSSHVVHTSLRTRAPSGRSCAHKDSSYHTYIQKYSSSCHLLGTSCAHKPADLLSAWNDQEVRYSVAPPSIILPLYPSS